MKRLLVLVVLFTLWCFFETTASAQPRDWWERCWTIGFQEVETDVFLAYQKDSRVSLLTSGKTFNQEEMTRCFYAEIQRDKYDFVYYDQTTPGDYSYVAGFLRAMNASNGTGVDRDDRSYTFGSRGKLVGVGNTSFGIANSQTDMRILQNQNFYNNMFIHEWGHRNCCSVGTENYDYRNKFLDGFGHWSRYLGRYPRGGEAQATDNCSPMLAVGFRELPNGEAVTRGCNNDTLPLLSDWEMYLSGFVSRESIKGKQFPLVAMSGDRPSFDTYRAPILEWLTVEDLVAKMDGKVVWPPPEFSQKHFRTAFILVLIPGTESGPMRETIAKWKDFSKSAAEAWHKATGGISTMNDPAKMKPTLLVTKDYLRKWESYYKVGEMFQLELTDGPADQTGLLVAFDGKKQYTVPIRTDLAGKATFSVPLTMSEVGTWSVIANFGGDISSNATTFVVRER